jgi:hypothetical protein
VLRTPTASDGSAPYDNWLDGAALMVFHIPTPGCKFVCTSDGKVSVFDLAHSRSTLCQQKIVKKAKLTKNCLNPKHPILLVGDDHGWCDCTRSFLPT